MLSLIHARYISNKLPCTFTKGGGGQYVGLNWLDKIFIDLNQLQFFVEIKL